MAKTPAQTGDIRLGFRIFALVSDFRNDAGQQASACGGVVVLRISGSNARLSSL